MSPVEARLLEPSRRAIVIAKLIAFMLFSLNGLALCSYASSETSGSLVVPQDSTARTTLFLGHLLLRPHLGRKSARCYELRKLKDAT